MCGIFGYLGTEQNVSELIHSGLRDLEYRGYDSWGIAVARGNAVHVAKEVGKLQNLAPNLGRGTLAIGHTRWATTGGVTPANAHPHTDRGQRIALVHNGIVENSEELREELIRDGFRFLSETDTEVIVALIEREFQRGADTLARASRKAFLLLEGLNAIAAIDAHRQDMVLIREGSPLVLGEKDGTYFAASDLGALAGQVERILHLRDGETAVISQTDVRISEIRTKKRIAPHWESLHWKKDDAALGSFPHYLAKEIAEQATMLRRMADEPSSSRDAASEFVSEASAIWLTGCGTAYHAALLGSYLLSSTGRHRSRALYAHELQHFTPTLADDHLVLSLSQSGETIDLIEAVRSVRKTLARTAALVNVPGSSLTRLVDRVVHLNAGPEKSVLSTKAYTSMVAYLIALSREEGVRLKNTLRQAATAIDSVLTESSQQRLALLASEIKDRTSLFCLGSGVYFPCALEAALKIKEVSYIHAEGFACGELKHGVIALIEPGTPCFVFVPEAGDERARALVSAQEIKARGGRILGISESPHPVFDDHIRIAARGNAFLLASVVPVQFLAYQLALQKGLDPDKPRNLAKSVTVR